MKRQSFLRKGETNNFQKLISSCADSLPESSSKKTSTASWARRQDDIAPSLRAAAQWSCADGTLPDKRGIPSTVWNRKACCWPRSRTSGWMLLPWCGRELPTDCTLPGRPWISVPWIHPKGWRCLHSRCWLAGSCGNYSSWYSLKRKESPGQSYIRSHLIPQTSLSRYAMQLVSLWSTQHLMKPFHSGKAKTKTHQTHNKLSPETKRKAWLVKWHCPPQYKMQGFEIILLILFLMHSPLTLQLFSIWIPHQFSWRALGLTS